MMERNKTTDRISVPNGWKVVKLGEIGEFKNGINKGKEDFGHGFPMVNLNDVFGRSTVNTQNLGLVNSTESERKDYGLIKGDVMFIRSSVKPSGVGLTAIIPYDMKDTVYSGFIIRFRDSGILDTNYKKYCFYDTKFRNRLLDKSTVSANTNINQVALSTLTIVIPPLPEQQKIAEILSTVDEKIEAIDQRIAETQALKKGLMQQLLTKGIGHAKFKDSPLGEIPESWEVKTLGQIFKLKSGDGLSKSNHVEGEIPVYGGNGIAFYHNKFNQESSQILIGRVGAYCGCVYLTEEKIWVTDNALIINEEYVEFNQKFLFYVLTKLNLNDYANKNAQPVISGGKIYPIKIGFPNLEEQLKIAEILSSVDEKLQIQQDKKIEYLALKKGLMQQLLTGKIRVKTTQD